MKGLIKFGILWIIISSFALSVEGLTTTTGITRNLFNPDKLRQIHDTVRCSFDRAKVDYEIIYSYMFFDGEDISDVHEFCYSAGAKLVTIRYPADHMFSHSIQLNAGARGSAGDFLVFCDADSCFSSDAVSQVKTILDTNPNSIVGGPWISLKEGYIDFNAIKAGNVPDSAILTKVGDALLLQWFYLNIQVIPRSVFFESQGYDERIRIWGEEDNEMFLRMSTKLKPASLPWQSTFHLWHSPHGNSIPSGFSYRDNNSICRNDTSFVKNDVNWGTEWSVGWKKESGLPKVFNIVSGERGVGPQFKIYTVGDSHSWHPWNNFNFISYNTLGSYTMFRLGRDKDIVVNDFPKDKPVCFCFGEIDCRCHVGRHQPWKETVEKLVENYFAAIELNRKVNPNIWIYSIPPPPRRADTFENPDVPFIGTDEERLSYQRYMNELLRKGPYTVVDICDAYAYSEGFMRLDMGDKHVHYEDPAPLAAWLKSRGYM